MRGWFKDDAGRVRPGWVVLAYVALTMFLFGVMGFVGWLLSGGAPRPRSLDDPHLAISSFGMLFAAGSANALCWFIFREKVGLEVSKARGVGGGIAFGLAAVSLAVLVPVLVGAVTLSSPKAPVLSVLLMGAQQLLTIGPTGIGEELLLRGLGFQALARATRPWVAVLVTGGLFGVMHLGNPNASWIAALDIALVGWWLGALVVRTGAVWSAIGLHVAWNFGEGFLWAHPVSGLQPGLGAVQASWPAEVGVWSGGDFGPEASGWTAVVLALGFALTVAWPRRSPEAGP